MVVCDHGEIDAGVTANNFYVVKQEEWKTLTF